MKVVKKIKKYWKRFCHDENGDLGAAAWVIGCLVIAVVVVLVIKALAPDTATTLWNTVWTWVQTQLGIN